MHTNGISVDQLVGTVKTIQEHPDLARFQFRSRTMWVTGGHSQTHVQSFFGPGQKDTSRKEPFVIESDEPPVLLGTNQGPNAVEMMLAALGSCLTVGVAYNAAARGITLKALSLQVEGDVDLQAFLGLSETVRPGFEAIRVRYQVVSDATPEQIEELMAHVQRTSPVLDIVRHPVPVTLMAE